jgi:hypothetical protein
MCRAVVAMQFPITDDAAIRFARTFYKCVAKGLPIDAAVAEGRKALFNDEAADWATPVLCLRTDDGNLLQGNAPPQPAAAPLPPPPAPAPEPPRPMPVSPPQPALPQRDTVRTLGIAAIDIVMFAIFAAIGDNLGLFGPGPAASDEMEASVEETPAEYASAAPVEEGPAADTSFAFDAAASAHAALAGEALPVDEQQEQ